MPPSQGAPPPVFQVLAELGGLHLGATEGTWNLGIGFLVVVDGAKADAVVSDLAQEGLAAWRVGTVQDGPRPEGDYEQGAKGVDGGAVRLVGDYRTSAAA